MVSVRGGWGGEGGLAGLANETLFVALSVIYTIYIHIHALLSAFAR